MTNRQRRLAEQPVDSALSPLFGSAPVIAVTPMLPQLLVTVDGAAGMLRVGRSTVYQLVGRGELRPVHIGRSVRFKVRDLEIFVDDLDSHGTTPAR